MTRLRTLVLAAALSLGLTPPPAGAQSDPSPQALEAARALTSVVSVSMMSELTANMNNQVWPGLEAAIRRHVPTVTRATLAELRREFERQQVGVIFESMNDAAVIYARHFTVQVAPPGHQSAVQHERRPPAARLAYPGDPHGLRLAQLFNRPVIEILGKVSAVVSG